MMGVDIQHEHPLVRIGKSHARQHYIVDIAEPRRLRRLSVVVSARWVERHVNLAGEDQFGASHASAGRQSR